MEKDARVNVAVYGGTFNPPHCGHLIVAESVRETLRLARILFIPTSTPPHKGALSLAPAPDRLAMTKLAVEGNDGFEASDIEVARGGLSYTVDTLRAVAARHPGSRLKLLIGADNVFDFEGWKSPSDILDIADLVVMSRPGYEIRKSRSGFLAHASLVTVPQIGISGTDIRRRVKFHQSIRYLVPPPVGEYIRRHGLYK
ncbi:MAG TPA: nicotinate-nucleotide adenylyltransferase [Bacteroidota bacterium]|nr:nicotinate-nucleotide adenylyltransferase [Bacteroidota bacterium]